MDLWYAGYGSNLSPDRFGAYLAGGSVRGTPSGWAEHGARDATAPRAEWTGQVELGVCFAGASRRWGGGGVGFVDPAAPPQRTHVRAYLISTGQFEDLHRQENQLAEVRPLDLDQLVEQGSVECYPSAAYSHAVVCDTHADGRPVVVVAGMRRPAHNPPDASYLRVMARGLAEGFGLTAADIAEYLAAWPGAYGVLEPAAIAAMIAVDSPDVT